MRDIDREFKEAFEQHADELFRHATIRLSDRERAAELTQECFLRAFEYARKGEEIREYRPFLFRTLRHLIIDEYRKHKSHSLEALLEDREGASVEALLPTDDSNTLEAAMERFEGKRALEMLSKLPPLYQEVLSLRYIDSLSPKEISGIIEESENVVSVRIHRGLKKLKDMLEEKQ